MNRHAQAKRRPPAQALMVWLKAWYLAAEKEAAKAPHFYVSDAGGLFANPREVIRAEKVKEQLQAYAELTKTLHTGEDKQISQPRTDS